jgi:hypothetical protein
MVTRVPTLHEPRLDMRISPQQEGAESKWAKSRPGESNGRNTATGSNAGVKSTGNTFALITNAGVTSTSNNVAPLIGAGGKKIAIGPMQHGDSVAER